VEGDTRKGPLKRWLKRWKPLFDERVRLQPEWIGEAALPSSLVARYKRAAVPVTDHMVRAFAEEKAEADKAMAKMLAEASQVKGSVRVARGVAMIRVEGARCSER
jgi:hypothetical protein